MYKEILYDKIIKDVSKIVKRCILESFNTTDKMIDKCDCDLLNNFLNRPIDDIIHTRNKISNAYLYESTVYDIEKDLLSSVLRTSNSSLSTEFGKIKNSIINDFDLYIFENKIGDIKSMNYIEDWQYNIMVKDDVIMMNIITPIKNEFLYNF